jgi:hypothetical protein
MSMSAEAQKVYDDALRTAVLRHGALVSRDTRYGWISSDWNHKRDCEMVSAQKVDESEWYDYAGSFADGEQSHIARRGFDLKGVNCACGYIKDRTIRWDASPSEAIEAVFEIAFTKEDE